MNDTDHIFGHRSYAIVDVSYCVKYYANAAWRRCKSDLGYQDDPEFDPMSLVEFEEIFSTYMDLSLSESILQQHPMHDRKYTLYCTDCMRSMIWRKDVYSQYKCNRDAIKPRFNYGSINSWVQRWLIQENQTYGNHTLFVECAEADDLIAALVQKLLQKEDGVPILIVSGDSDLLQLGAEWVSQIDAKGESVTIANKLLSDKVEFDPTPANFLMYKILTGDTSDGVPSVRYGKCGPKKAAQLLANQQALVDFLQSDPATETAFRRNHQLIGLNMVPPLLLESIELEIGKALNA